MSPNPTRALDWPPSPADAALRLLSIDTEVLIEAEPAAVHAYATNAFRWHEWHPATRSVEGVPDRPLVRGETIVEQIAVAGWRFAATWTVVAADAPRLWVIVTDAPRGQARIAYRLSSARTAQGAAATRFQRRLECRSRGRLLRWLDPLVVRWVLGPQSRRALDNLRDAVTAHR